MWDLSIPMIDLAMEAKTLSHLPAFPLPAEYGWRFFRPGDEWNWARIEVSAGEFERIEDGLARFRREFPTDDGLEARMLFLTDGGAPFATATAWYEPDGCGHLHYVAVDAAHQGRGLSRPLIGLALRRMAELGHTRARLTTQTASWLAIRLYREFGFRPEPCSDRDAEGWALVARKAGVPFELSV